MKLMVIVMVIQIIYINNYTQTYIHTYIHTCIHTHMHAYIHTYICMHAGGWLSGDCRSFGAEGRWFVVAPCGCLAAKFDSCNSLPSSVHIYTHKYLHIVACVHA